MKVPKLMKKYCPKCKKTTVMNVSQSKQRGKNMTHPLSRGSRKRMRLRGLDRGAGNQGAISRGAISSWKRYGAKKSKKINLKLNCKECNRSMTWIGQRAKKVEVGT